MNAAHLKGNIPEAPTIPPLAVHSRVAWPCVDLQCARVHETVMTTCAGRML
jgi:hypothetical protein